jgi:lysophospholipase L1-like esterase
MGKKIFVQLQGCPHLFFLLLSLFFIGSFATAQVDVACFGDSITAGYGATQSYCARLESMGTYITYNYGTGGDASEDMLARIDQVTGKGYNYTIVLAGTNDLAQGVSNLSYYSNLLDIVSRLQTDRQNVILSTIPPFGWHLSNTSERNNVIRRVAYERNACYVDIFTDVFEGTYNQSLFFDGVHPNDNAHYLMALEYNDSITNCIRYDCQANPQNCYAPPVNQPTGWFDGIKNTIIPSVGGWACDPDNYSRYLTIHLYLDGPYPSGTFIGITVANLSGESAIGAYCGGTTSHRFVYNMPPLDYGIGRDYRVYAYALDYPTSVNKTLLGGSPAILKSKPLLGAIRWDFYFNNSYDLRSLSRDQKWHYRIPLTSQVAWNGTAYNAVGGVDTQEKVDYEIAAAKRGGIDYWAFLYYDPMSLANTLLT